jgi:hypothetical protein
MTNYITSLIVFNHRLWIVDDFPEENRWKTGRKAMENPWKTMPGRSWTHPPKLFARHTETSRPWGSSYNLGRHWKFSAAKKWIYPTTMVVKLDI